MSKLERWKFLMPLTMAVLFIAAMTSGAWATTTNKVTIRGAQVSLTQQSYPMLQKNLHRVDGNITISGSTNSSIETNTYITLTAPEGYKFVGVDGTSTNSTNSTKPFMTRAAKSAAKGDNASAINSTIEFDYTKDALGNNRVTSIKYLVSEDVAKPLIIGLDVDASPDDKAITLVPLNWSDKKHEKDLKLTVTANDGSSDAVTQDVGSLNFLQAPYIKTAVALDSGTVELTFNVPLDLSTCKAGNFTIAGSSANVTAPVQTDSNTPTKVTLYATNSITAGSDNVTFNKASTGNPSCASAYDYLDDNTQDINGTHGDIDGKPVTIASSYASIDKITVNKSRVGVDASADDVAIATFTISGSAGSPLKLRLIKAGDPTKIIRMSQTSNSDVNASCGCNSPRFGDANTTISAVMRDTGICNVKLTFVGSAKLSDNTTIAFPKSAEANVTLTASVDDFASSIASPVVTVDRKAPQLITTGDNKVYAPNRTTVVMHFNESLNATLAQTKGLYTINGSNPKSAVVSADGKTVTLTTLLLESAKSYKVSVAGVKDKVGNQFTGDSNQFRTADVGITSVTASNQKTGSFTVKNGSKVKVIVKAPTGSGTLNARAVDAANKSVIVSLSNKGNSKTSVNASETSEGTWTWDKNNTDGNLTLSSDLSGVSNVIVQVSSDPIFLAGVSESAPLTVDNTRPTVFSASNSDSTHIVVTFSEDMQLSTLIDAKVYHVIPSEIQVIDAKVDPSDLRTVTLTVTQLTNDTEYTVNVNSTPTDLAGNTVNDVNVLGIDEAKFTAGAAKCDASHPNLCTTEATCTAVGGSWDMTTLTCEAAVSVCDADHPDLCTTEAECTGAGLNWCNGACQVAACEIPPVSSTSPTLKVQYNKGTGSLNAAATKVPVSGDQKADVTIAPGLNVPTGDQGSTVNLYAAIVPVGGSRLYMAKKGGIFGVGVDWVEYTGGTIPFFKTVTLGATQTFNVGLDNMPLTDVTGSFDIYYGYATKADLSDFIGSCYEVDFE